jgi:hypothetical protein
MLNDADAFIFENYAEAFIFEQQYAVLLAYEMQALRLQN